MLSDSSPTLFLCIVVITTRNEVSHFVARLDGSLRFRWVKAPTSTELTQLAHKVARRVSRFLERQGLLERDAENSYLAREEVETGLMDQILGVSITYRIAVGPQQGRKVFTLRTLPARDPQDQVGDTVGKAAGFSLHAGVSAKAHERQKLERLCRYITRPPIAERRLSLTEHGKVRYELKTPCRDGTTHVIFEPLDFIARLAALVPKPRGNKSHATDEGQEPTPAERRASMTWAQRLNRVFNIDIATCQA